MNLSDKPAVIWKQSTMFYRLMDCIGLLSIHDILPYAEVVKARRRLLKKLQKEQKQKPKRGTK